ncbi:MAG: hypothetical protein E7D52_05410 [Peptoniphilus harei]|uniref:hypothetical protein n=1 Tax=Peptoniphilus harei TaxID=54005 RepID=UPI0029030B0C|nr:hypothetical protein [Peptoniphilus harei]MDU2373971.1 hypothetical protein [Peptoniphilus harei]
MTMNKSKLLEVNLRDFLEIRGEEKTHNLLDNFDSKYNEDVNYFLKTKAEEFGKRGLASTYLVFTKYKEKLEFLAYYSLAMKAVVIKSDANISKTLRKKINTYSNFEPKLKSYVMSCHLIGQLGKNYNANDESLISGSELLELACRKVRAAQEISGGKFVYLECENVKSLINFYEKNGFTKFGMRKLDKEETDLNGSYLVQLIRYLK